MLSDMIYFSYAKKQRYLPLLALTLAAVMLAACSKGLVREQRYGSIFDRDYALPVLAESFSGYEWNAQSKRAYELYLEVLNKYYYTLDYEMCNVLFYDAIDIYPHDARLYVRLAESIARTGDVVRALDVLHAGDRAIPGFSESPRIHLYIEELDRAKATQKAGQSAGSKKMVSKVTGIVTWLPRKIKNLF